MGKLFKQVYYGSILIPSAEREQDVFYDKLEKLKRYRPQTDDDIKKRDFFKKYTKLL